MDTAYPVNVPGTSTGTMNTIDLGSLRHWTSMDLSNWDLLTGEEVFRLASSGNLFPLWAGTHRFSGDGNRAGKSFERERVACVQCCGVAPSRH